MNKSKKVGRLGRELQRVGVSSNGSENLQESNVLPVNFFNDQNRDITSSVTWPERFEDFCSFWKYIFHHKLVRFCCFSKFLHYITSE